MIHELSLRPDLKEAKEAIEILRGWVVDGDPKISFHSGLKGGPQMWGRFTADILRQIASWHGEQTKSGTETREKVLAEMCSAMKDELNKGWPGKETKNQSDKTSEPCAGGGGPAKREPDDAS